MSKKERKWYKPWSWFNGEDKKNVSPSRLKKTTDKKKRSTSKVKKKRSSSSKKSELKKTQKTIEILLEEEFQKCLKLKKIRAPKTAPSRDQYQKDTISAIRRKVGRLCCGNYYTEPTSNSEIITITHNEYKIKDLIIHLKETVATFSAQPNSKSIKDFWQYFEKSEKKRNKELEKEINPLVKFHQFIFGKEQKIVEKKTYESINKIALKLKALESNGADLDFIVSEVNKLCEECGVKILSKKSKNQDFYE